MITNEIVLDTHAPASASVSLTTSYHETECRRRDREHVTAGKFELQGPKGTVHAGVTVVSAQWEEPRMLRLYNLHLILCLCTGFSNRVTEPCNFTQQVTHSLL